MTGSVAHRAATARPRKRAMVRVGVVRGAGSAHRRARHALAGDGIDLLDLAPEDLSELAEGALDVLVLQAGPSGPTNGVVAALLADLPPIPVVLVLPSPDRASIDAALRAGARGVVADEELRRAGRPAVAAVAVGQIVVPAAYASVSPRALLSAREKQVLSMVVLGFSNLEVANKLFIAETTVKSHLSSAYRKLGVSSRQEATALILTEQGLGLGILTLSGERLGA